MIQKVGYKHLTGQIHSGIKKRRSSFTMLLPPVICDVMRK